MTPHISIIVPTVGRPTLRRTITMAIRAMGMRDELIVVGDGPLPAARAIMAETGDPRIFYMETVPTHKWGCAQYDFGSSRARGDFLMFSTDDDAILEDAVETVRAEVEDKPWPHVFAMYHMPQGRVLKNSVKRCEVGAHQIVVPNDPTKLAKWADDLSETNDHAYLMTTLRNWGRELPEFHNQTIAVMLQHAMGRLP